MLRLSRFLSRPRRINQTARLYSRSHNIADKDVVELAFSALKSSPSAVLERPEGPLVILHGLFGSKRNWNSLCKAFHRDLPGRAVYSLDLRNHGSSPHARPMTYAAMAEDVKHFLSSNGLRNVSLLGHSMGAKVAMTVALSLSKDATNSDTISRLIVADLAPAKLDLSNRLTQYVSAMQDINAMPHGMIKTLQDADRVLDPFEQDPAIRRFLLTNLLLPRHSRTAEPRDRAKFLIPLDILKEAIPSLAEFPYDYQLSGRPQWDGPTLVIAGGTSEYKILDYTEAFKAFFPQSRFETLDAGHWVHAEKPNEFKKLVVDFISSR
ncbi:mitochondrial protein [Coprinopsis marcescibilis]|uniref:Mitochondrial protein n=1 Tax=Coprinopsis marcescibilis TaxID=230819 RepID=A0A5C3L572_COPMA|nr:mitochondrial protein [Coprinopsis marcescibilis]